MTSTDLLTGTVVRPGDADYDQRRAVFNAMIDRRPAMILRCASPEDVARGIRYARAQDLALSVRGGGHNVAGSAVCDGGLTLDLSPMRSVTVDPVARLARTRAGALLGDLDRATAVHGLATPTGVMSGTGVAGLTLGGGLGWLAGKYGLACDNLVDAEVVTADGEVLSSVGPDLLWGLRGGGGNLAVVTTLVQRLHPVRTVVAGGFGYQWAAARDVLAAHEQIVTAAPDELATAVSLARGADGQPSLGIAVCWCGPAVQADAALRPLRALGPLTEAVGEMPFVDWQCAPDAGYPRGRLHYWKSGYLRRRTAAAIDTLVALAEDLPPGDSGIGLQSLRGAAARVAPDATAFPHRAPQDDFLILSQWSDPDATDRHISWTRTAFAAMEPHLERAVYVNNLGEEGPDRVRAAYGVNHARLAELKRRWDPDNVLRLNQNVAPAPS
jgi:FAD/FMN-containing dehydrogenase